MEAFAGWHSAVTCTVSPLATVLLSADTRIVFTGWVTTTVQVS